jgi:DNA-binding NtrC family response regulator
MSHILRMDSVAGADPAVQNPQPTSDPATLGGFIPSSEMVPNGEISTLRRVLDEAEMQVIRRALHHTGWNRKRAAALLKISYRGLLYKIRRHSITPPLAGNQS